MIHQLRNLSTMSYLCGTYAQPHLRRRSAIYTIIAIEACPPARAACLQRDRHASAAQHHLPRSFRYSRATQPGFKIVWGKGNLIVHGTDLSTALKDVQSLSVRCSPPYSPANRLYHRLAIAAHLRAFERLYSCPSYRLQSNPRI